MLLPNMQVLVMFIGVALVAWQMPWVTVHRSARSLALLPVQVLEQRGVRLLQIAQKLTLLFLGMGLLFMLHQTKCVRR